VSTPTPITPNQATGNDTRPGPEVDVETFINEYYAAWHGIDEDRIMSYYSEDVTVQIPGGLMQGQTAVREQFVRPYITGFPRNRHLVKNMIFGRDEVTVEFTFDAQHTGPFAGHAASDTHVHLAGCAVYRYDLARRQITTARIYFDVATLLKQLLDPGYSHGVTDEGTAHATVGRAAPTDYLDLATVIAVSQAVSGEMVLERLLNTLMQTAVTHAGAERALLILSRESEPRIAAEATASGDAVSVHLCDEPITGAALPEAILRYVLRTRDSVILDDAAVLNPFTTDRYIAQQKARSVFCLALTNQTHLIGALYLEHNHAPRVFAPARTAVLKLLASQAAISIENSRLYRDLAEREAKVRSLVDANIIGIFTWHTDGRVFDANEEFLRIIGYSREDLASRRLRWTDFTLPEWHEPDARVMEQLKRGGAAPAQERELLKKDGSRVPVFAGGTLFSGTPDEGVAFVVDLTERKQAEQAAQERERESRLIVDTIPGLVAILTPVGEVDVVNRELVEYCGQRLEAMKGWGANGTVHPDDLPHVGQIFGPAIAAGTPYDFDARIRRFDGVYRWCQVRGLPLRDSNGGITRWYVVLTDIDERKRAEQALRDSERDLKLIIDTIPALAWSARTDGSAEFFNRHYLDFIGLSEEQARGWGWTTAVHPEDLNELASAWQRIMASNAAGEAEARLRRSDATYRWFLFRANPLRDERGNIVQWYGINTDIEGRKQAEAELRRAYDSFAEAQGLSHTGSFITDLVGDDHNWSDEAFRIFDFERGSKVSVQRIRQIIHPDDLPSFESVIARGMEGENVTFAFRIVTATGAFKHVRGVAHVVEHVAGRPLFVGALQDVTESKVAEEALDRARAELARVARVTTVSAFTASIAHEVSQPLSGIITNAGTCLRMLAASPPDVDGARETAKRTLRDGNRASDVITRLRALFSRREFTLEPLNINEIAQEVIALSLNELQRNRMILRSQFPADLPLITGDRIQLQQVILNLLRNASDAMLMVDERPRDLLIATERDTENRVRLTVRDVGVGLDAQTLDKLFDAFYTTKIDGMGVGLSVSRSIIERHHGSLWAVPNDGPGTTFAFAIPAAAKSVASATGTKVQ
jgi:PAS domain S-box-containing protein